MPNSCTERKCGHVNTTHDIATAVSSALYRMRRVSQYRRESATERLNSSILKEYEFLQMCVKYFVVQRRKGDIVLSRSEVVDATPADRRVGRLPASCHPCTVAGYLSG